MVAGTVPLSGGTAQRISLSRRPTGRSNERARYSLYASVKDILALWFRSISSAVGSISECGMARCARMHVYGRTISCDGREETQARPGIRPVTPAAWHRNLADPCGKSNATATSRF